jgi:surface protein
MNRINMTLRVLLLTLFLAGCGGSNNPFSEPKDFSDSEAIIYPEDPRPFVTTWKVDSLGYPDDNTIEIPLIVSGYKYDFTVDWGDGSTDENVTQAISHTYFSPGTYTVSISGGFPGWEFPPYTPNNKKLMSIEQWGGIQWRTMKNAFRNCSSLVSNANDQPNLSLVKDMSNMFADAGVFNGDLSYWDVSSVTDMSYMFYDANGFNGDISNWDTSSAINMNGMFSSANAFNGDISNWEVSSVKDMSNMFEYAKAFNADLSNWDVSSVTDMSYMFYLAITFNGELNNWDVSSVKNMEALFREAIIFNKDLNNWDVSSVTDMTLMFTDAVVFNDNISGWDVSSVRDMNAMFMSATAFNGDLRGWNLHRGKSMQNMFHDAGLSTDNYDALLIDWVSKTPSHGVHFNGGDSTCTTVGKAARDTLMNTYNWTFFDGCFTAL